MELLEVENLYKEFYKDKIKFAAVDHIHFSIREGECLGLVGESGCGKSTTASLIAGLLKPDKGTFRFFGEELTKSSSRRIRKNIQMIFQNPMDSFDPRYHLLSSVQQGLRYVEKCDKRELERRAQEAISFVGLKESYYKKPIHQLSGGECQRAAIARAIIGQPKLLICDEATSALDPNTTHAILTLIKDINKKLGITVVVITHQMSVVEEICDSVAILDGGVVVEQGEVREIFANPKTAAARRLVAPNGGSAARDLSSFAPDDHVVRVTFNGSSAAKPLVASLAAEKGILVSVLSADTRDLSGQCYGSMLLKLPRDTEQAKQAAAYMRSQNGVTVEEVTGE